MKQGFKLTVTSKKHMKSLLFILFLVLFNALLSQQYAFAEPSREQQIKQAGTLRVCIWPDYFSISYKNSKTGQLEGIDIDLSQELAQDLGVEVEYVATHFGIFMTDIQQDK